MDIVEKGRHVWQSKRSKMIAEDWIIVGKALKAGKDWCSGRKGYGGPKGFGKWCKENGFAEVKAQIRSDAIWLASPEGESFYSDDLNKNIHHPQAIHAAYRAQQKEKLGKSIREAVLERMSYDTTKTVAQVADEIGIERTDVARRVTELKKAGRLSQDGNKYTLVKPDSVADRISKERDLEINELISRLNRSSAALAENVASNSKNKKSALDRLYQGAKEGRSIYNLQTFENKRGRVFINHGTNIGDVMSKTTAQGIYGKVSVSVIVEIVDA